MQALFIGDSASAGGPKAPPWEDCGSFYAVWGAIRVTRVVCALDMGVVVNPEGARMQAEGGITMGLGYSLAEELRFLDGDVLDGNFNSYSLPLFSWVPKIEVVLVSNDALAPQGGGEPPIVTTGAVIANAVFDATGVRLFRLPMTPPRVKRALANLQAWIRRLVREPRIPANIDPDEAAAV